VLEPLVPAGGLRLTNSLLIGTGGGLSCLTNSLMIGTGGASPALLLNSLMIGTGGGLSCLTNSFTLMIWYRGRPPAALLLTTLLIWYRGRPPAALLLYFDDLVLGGGLPLPYY